MTPNAPFLMGLCFLNGAEPGGLYRNIGRQRRYEASLCAVGAIMRAFCPRGPFANIRMVSYHRRGRTGDDNGAIIKMKRAGHSLAHDRSRAVERSGAQPSSFDAVLRGTKTYTHARDELYEIFFLRARQTSTGIFGTAVSFFALYYIPEIRILFWRESRYISRDMPRVGWFTANCKCKFDSGFLSRELKITATRERLLLFRDLYPLLPEFVYSIFHAAAANRKRESRNWVLR